MATIYLVEVFCGGKHAAGGGCGALRKVSGIRELRPGDRLGTRESPDSDADLYPHFSKEKWDAAHPETSIEVIAACSDCYKRY
jgi:hypothetical protein